MAIRSSDSGTATIDFGNAGTTLGRPDGGIVSLWVKVDAWASADQPVLSWQLETGFTSSDPALVLWVLQRVGSTDALEIVNTPASGSAASPIALSVGSIAGTGWHHLMIYGAYYAWDGTLTNSGAAWSPGVGQYENHQALKLYPTADLQVAEMGVGKTFVIDSGSTLVATLTRIAGVLHAYGPVSDPRQDWDFYNPLNQPRYASYPPDGSTVSVASDAEYVFGPPLNAYRDVICGETSMVAYCPLEEVPDLGEFFGRNLGDSPRPLGSDATYFRNGGAPSSVIGRSLEFVHDGTSPVTVAADANIAPTSALSVEAWIWAEGTRPHDALIVAKPVGSTPSAPLFDYALSLDPTGFVTFSVGISSTLHSATSATQILSGYWYHLVGTYDGSTLSVYIDGALDGTPVSVSGSVLASGQALCIGGPGSASYDPGGFGGWISQVAIYNAALDATAVAAHFTASAATAPPTPGPSRVTQLVTEVLYSGAGAGRVTQLVSEVLYSGQGAARVTQLVTEVLSSLASGTDYTVSGSSTLGLHTIAARIPGNDYAKSATSTINVHAAASEVYSVSRPVSASSGIVLQDRALGSSGGPRPVSASSSFVLGVHGRDPDNPNVNVSATDHINLHVAGTPQALRFVSASSTMNFSGTALEYTPARHSVTATATINVRAAARGYIPQDRAVVAASQIQVVAPDPKVVTTAKRVHVLETMRLHVAAIEDSDYSFRKLATARVALADSAHAQNARSLRVFAADRVGLGIVAGSNIVDSQTAMTTFGVHSSAKASRDLAVSATTSVGFSLAEHYNPLYAESATGHFSIGVHATAVDEPLGVRERVKIRDVAHASNSLPAGGGVPGAFRLAFRALSTAPPEPAQGLRNLIYDDVSGTFPFSYAETPEGLVLIANGVDPMLRWDGLSGDVEPAGVVAPVTAPAFGGVGVGSITGLRVAYQRFVDRWGNTSSLSPVSLAVDFGRDGVIDAIHLDPASGLVTVASEGHGLAVGDPIILSQVEGLPLSGTFTLASATADTFTLAGVTISSGVYRGGGVWTYGVSQVVYSNLELPDQPKVARRQLLRNLASEGETFYVDIDTDDLTSTFFLSSASDEVLAAGDPVPLLFEDDLPAANRFYPPPSSKSVLAAHQGRIFATADVTIRAGAILPSFGQSVVPGIGTDFRATFAGRTLYIPGASQVYEIASADPVAQTLTLVGPINDGFSGPVTYAIRPPQGERKFVYYTEPGYPEAWPPYNAIAVPEDGDTITGLMVQDSFLYVLEERHIYKYTLQSDPARDGFLFLSTRRGAVNNRCVAHVEGTSYLLDDCGVHAFDGNDSTPISTPIQSLFQKGVGLDGQLEVNWDADRTLWHAAADPIRETIRWFVAMSGTAEPRHAICYDYRRQSWWIEEYPFPVTSSTVATISYRRSLVGSDGGRVLCLSEGTLDLVDPKVGGLGVVSSAGPLSLSDSSAPFADGLAGATVSIALGKGLGQQRRISGNTPARLDLDRPWTVIPDATSRYQVGGVHWSWRSGWFRISETEDESPRDVAVVFQPVKKSAYMDLELYYDHSEGPRLWAYSDDRDGVATSDGSSRIGIDLTRKSGYAIQRLSGHGSLYADGDYFCSVRISGVQGPEATRVHEIVLNGAR